VIFAPGPVALTVSVYLGRSTVEQSSSGDPTQKLAMHERSFGHSASVAQVTRHDVTSGE
jgi:hypothetical protein